ncbi:MAG: GntR family transcriptional regulator [Anaerolineae bacterium]|jgi:DNA-binding GntR family transcriptional regulator
MRLSEKAYHLIKEKIITLELPPSSLINEQSLMDELGLGRTPIREALQRLEMEDLITIVPRRGAFVADISITDLYKIFETRIFLEGFCARLAAQRATAEQLSQMQDTIAQLEQASDNGVKTLMDIDARFHQLLYQAADNEFLADVLKRLYDLSLRIWYLVLERIGDVQHAIAQHEGVVNALQAQDGDLAEALIQEHVIQFQQDIKDAL